MLFLVMRTSATEEERSFKIINAANGLADNSAQIVKCTSNGRLIISTIGNLNFYDGKTFAHANSRPEYEYELPLYTGHYHLYFDHHNHIWLKDKVKVTCLDLKTERFIANVDSVIRALGCDVPVADLFVDQNGQVWFLTANGLYNNEYKRYFTVSDTLSLQDVEVYGNDVYFFYENGEVVAQDTLGHVICQSKAYDSSVAPLYAGSSVVLPYGEGFYQIRNGDKQSVLLFFNVKTNTWQTVMAEDYHLNNLVTDKSGEHIYIPCEYGYWIYTPATGEKEHLEQVQLTDGSMMGTDCNTMAFDHQGGMWIGTEHRGVLYARPHSLSFKAYPWSNPLALKYDAMMDTLQQNINYYEGKRANCRYVDSRGWVWIGTRVGLYMEKPGETSVELFNRARGLNNNVIHSLVEDRDHNIWAATSCGISFLLIRDGNVVFINNFTDDDNVPNESFENCKALLLKDGTIIMKAIEHVVAFKPEELQEVNEPHLVTNIRPVLTRMLVNGNTVIPMVPIEGNIIVDRALTGVRDINLKSDQNSISLAFSALNYFRPRQTSYRVRVYETGMNWTVYSSYTADLVDNTGVLHFPMVNLEPGDYTVEVQASMFPDIWEEDIDDSQRFRWYIHVKQPWWRSTGLFYLIGLVLLAMLIINFILFNRNSRMRVRRNDMEGDILRKIRYYVDRCEAYVKKVQKPLNDDHMDGMSSDPKLMLSPEFIELMLKLMPYVSEHENKNLTMRKLCEVGDVDIVTLYEVVSGNLYKNPRELARHIKLRQATDLLSNTNLSIEEIAQKCGFYTPNYFIGNFFHEYKMTPAEYRKNH